MPRHSLALGVLAILAVAPAWAATYVVDGQHPQAADENPGSTAERPFKTIGKAVRAVQPGDVVVIQPGVYREAVARFHLRGSPERVTVFRAATGESPVVSGADVVTEWESAGGKVWAAPWPHRFVDAAIPLGWPEQAWKFPMNRKEAVFVDGCPLRPVATREAMSPGSFFVDEQNGKLLVWLLDGGSPKEHTVEASVRGPLWRFQGCSHVRVEGLAFRDRKSVV